MSGGILRVKKKLFAFTILFCIFLALLKLNDLRFKLLFECNQFTDALLHTN